MLVIIFLHLYRFYCWFMMVDNYHQHTIIHDKATIKVACLFWAFWSLVDLSRETCHAFWSRSRTPTYLCYSYTGNTQPHMLFIHYCSMRIKVTSLAILHQKERHGLQKKEVRKNKTTKSSSVQKREREWERKVAMPSQKQQAREGKLLKGVPLPPNIPHTCTSWSISMICCSSWSKCLT